MVWVKGFPGGTDMQDVSLYTGQFYVTGRLGDHYAIALGAWVPYALKTHWWASDPVATSALKTSWTSREYNANLIARLNDEWSLAVGLEVVRVSVEDFSRLYDFTFLEGFLILPPPEPLDAQQNITLAGDKAGVNAAIHYRGTNGYRFGLSFRSQKIVRMEGRFRWGEVSDATFLPTTNLLDPSGCPAPPTPCPMSAAFTDSRASSDFVIPATVQFGFGQVGRGKWDWEVDFLWTKWSKWDSLDIEVEDPNGVGTFFIAIPTTFDVNYTEDWSDTVTWSGGFDYHVNDRHAVRGGLVVDPTPGDDEFLRPYIVNAGRIGLTAGYGWRGLGGRLAVDAFGQFFVYDDVTTTDRPLQFVVGGTYETTEYTLGVSFQYTF